MGQFLITAKYTAMNFLMVRKGEFFPSHFSSNQCKENGHASYGYEIRMVFHHAIVLNSKKFIIDHHDIDLFIQKLTLSGSCETMHIELQEGLLKFFEKRKISTHLICMKTTIMPDKSKKSYISAVYSNHRWTDVTHFYALLM